MTSSFARAIISGVPNTRDAKRGRSAIARNPVGIVGFVDLDQYADQQSGSALAMPSFMYRCPVQGIQTHAWIADEIHAKAGKDEFISISCIACQQGHLMNPKTGMLAGSGNDTKRPPA
jgi:hypothetical protein